MNRLGVVAISLLIALGCLFFSCVGVVNAQTIELKFAHAFSPKHTLQAKVFEPWAEKISKLTNGKVKVTFYPGGALGKAPDLYGLAEKGIADIVYTLHDYTPGRFPMTTVFELPFMITSATQASDAMWKTFEKFPAFSKEYSKVKVLGLFAHPPGLFHTIKKPIKSIEDLKGMKMRTASPSVTKALKVFGATPVSIPVTETYTALERGVVDGTVVPWEGVVVFKLDDLLKYSTPTNFYTMTMMVVMNKRKWDSLPDDVKKVIDENSGLAMSLACGEIFDKVEQPLKKRCLGKGMKVVELPPDDITKLKALADPLRSEWVKDMKAKGLPGKEVMEGALEFLK